MAMLDIWFDKEQDTVLTTTRWATKNGEETDDIFISLRTSFGEWTQLHSYNDMLDHLLNEWKLSSNGKHYRLNMSPALTWVYVDEVTFENMRDTVIELVRKRELAEVTAKFAELTARGE